MKLNQLIEKLFQTWNKLMPFEQNSPPIVYVRVGDKKYRIKDLETKIVWELYELTFTVEEESIE